MDPAEAIALSWRNNTGVDNDRVLTEMGLVLLLSGMNARTNNNNVVTGIFFRSVKYWKRNCMEMLGNLL